MAGSDMHRVPAKRWRDSSNGRKHEHEEEERMFTEGCLFEEGHRREPSTVAGRCRAEEDGRRHRGGGQGSFVRLWRLGVHEESKDGGRVCANCLARSSRATMAGRRLLSALVGFKMSEGGRKWDG